MHHFQNLQILNLYLSSNIFHEKVEDFNYNYIPMTTKKN